MAMAEREMFRPPEFEIRANVFASQARWEAKKFVWKHARNVYLHFRIEKSLSVDMDCYSALDRTLGNMAALGELSPRKLADENDRMTAEMCVIGIHAECDDRLVLKGLIEKVFGLAKKHSGVLDEEYNPIISTQSETDHIVDMGREWDYLMSSSLFFRFSDSLTG